MTRDAPIRHWPNNPIRTKKTYFAVLCKLFI